MKQIFFIIFLLFQTIFGVGRFYSPKYFQLDEIPDHQIRNPRADDTNLCNEDALIELLAEMQVINPENIMEMATLNQLEPICSKIADKMGKMQEYLSNCNINNQPDLYIQLVNGVEVLYKKMCTDSDFKKKYEPYHQCLRELRNDFQECRGPPDWNEFSDNKDVCKAYKEIIDCYYIKSAKVCGEESANTLKELIKAIVNSIITVKCDINSNPVVKDPMPEAYIRKINNNSQRQSMKPKIVQLTLILIQFLF